MGEEQGGGRHEGSEAQAGRPDTRWSKRKKGRADREEQPGRVMRLDPSMRSRRIEHPSLAGKLPARRIVLTPLPEPTLTLTDSEPLVDLVECGNGCGKGAWCEACRAEIRAEALKWLRELNAPRQTPSGEAVSWSRAWHHQVLLADR